MIWHLKTAKADTPREADIGMEHLCSVGKCSIGETCNLIFEVLEPYRITRFQRRNGDVPWIRQVLEPYRITRLQRHLIYARNIPKVAHEIEKNSLFIYR